MQDQTICTGPQYREGTIYIKCMAAISPCLDVFRSESSHELGSIAAKAVFVKKLILVHAFRHNVCTACRISLTGE